MKLYDTEGHFVRLNKCDLICVLKFCVMQETQWLPHPLEAQVKLSFLFFQQSPLPTFLAFLSWVSNLPITSSSPVSLTHVSVEVCSNYHTVLYTNTLNHLSLHIFSFSSSSHATWGALPLTTFNITPSTSSFRLITNNLFTLGTFFANSFSRITPTLFLFLFSPYNSLNLL